MPEDLSTARAKSFLIARDLAESADQWHKLALRIVSTTQYVLLVILLALDLDKSFFPRYVASTVEETLMPLDKVGKRRTMSNKLQNSNLNSRKSQT